MERKQNSKESERGKWREQQRRSLWYVFIHSAAGIQSLQVTQKSGFPLFSSSTTYCLHSSCFGRYMFVSSRLLNHHPPPSPPTSSLSLSLRPWGCHGDEICSSNTVVSSGEVVQVQSLNEPLDKNQATVVYVRVFVSTLPVIACGIVVITSL